jgi:hypothetical protein
VAVGRNTLADALRFAVPGRRFAIVRAALVAAVMFSIKLSTRSYALGTLKEDWC